MNISMELAQKECGRYFTNYGKCVERFPHTWHMDCLQHKTKLAKCTETNPVVVEIKKKCSEEFTWYDKCASRSPANLENCNQQFAAFDSCADKVTNEYHEKVKSPKKTISS